MFRHDEDERFIFIMGALAELCNQQATPMKIKIYAQALHDLPVEDIEMAAWNLINTRTFATFPKPAEIRDAINGKAEDKAILAANTIEQATSRGPYRSIVFDDPYIMATILSLGGWEHFCDISATEEWVFFKKEIEKTYSALSKRSLDSIEIPLRLAGFVERNNSAMGITKNSISGAVLHKVEYVGDTEKIKAWRGKVKRIEQDNGPQIGNAVKGMLEHIGREM